ncbi:MAG: type II secretion system protein [Planctomycetota bacterium]|jgi:prepilin-type N-terminal cleavage/methylation domain-containing protein
MKTHKKGFTLVELMVTVGIVAIVILGVGVALVDSQRGWHKMYDRVHGEVATDSYVAKITFDKIVRKSSQRRHIIGTQNITLFYYNSLTSTRLDRYAAFRRAGRDLLVDYGDVDDSGTPLRPSTTTPLARNVEVVKFVVEGACVKMLLKLDDGKESVTVTSSAVRHNE